MCFKIKGVRVLVTWHFLALITFMLSLRAQNVFSAVIFSLFHETGHLALMLLLENPPVSVSFELTGINIKRNESTAVSLQNEILIAFGGPLVNFLLFVIFVLMYSHFKNPIFLNAASVNLILSVFNLLPVKGLDGGKMLYYFVSKYFSFKSAQTVLRVSSVIFISLLFSYGVYILYVTKYNFTVLIIVLMLSLSMFSREEC